MKTEMTTINSTWKKISESLNCDLISDPKIESLQEIKENASQLYKEVVNESQNFKEKNIHVLFKAAENNKLMQKQLNKLAVDFKFPN